LAGSKKTVAKFVHPPRELRPSQRGLFDLHGNLFEWTHDWLLTSKWSLVMDGVYRESFRKQSMAGLGMLGDGTGRGFQLHAPSMYDCGKKQIVRLAQRLP